MTDFSRTHQSGCVGALAPEQMTGFFSGQRVGSPTKPLKPREQPSIQSLIGMSREIADIVRRVRDTTCETADRLLGSQSQISSSEGHSMPDAEIDILEDTLRSIRSAAYQAQDEANRLSAL